MLPPSLEAVSQWRGTKGAALWAGKPRPGKQESGAALA